MKETKNYKLKKPDYTDVADIADINYNMDILDVHKHLAKDFTDLDTATTGKAKSLSTARKINGISFDGTADITITANPTQTRLTTEDLSTVVDIGEYWAAGGNTVTDFPVGAGSSETATAIGGFTLKVYQCGGLGRLQMFFNDKGTWYRVGTLSDTITSWSNWIRFFTSNKPVNINGISFDGTNNIEITANPKDNVLATEDLDTVITQGNYVANSANTCNNKPDGVTAFGLTVTKGSNASGISGAYTQILTTPAGAIDIKNKIFVRMKESGVWKPWGEIYTTYSQPSAIPYYVCNDNIADGLDVYTLTVDTASATQKLVVNTNYGIGDTFGIIFDKDFTNTSDVHLTLTFNNAAIHNGIMDDTEGVSIINFEAGVLYKVTVGAPNYILEKATSTSAVATISADRKITNGTVFFTEFAYDANVYSGLELQTLDNSTNPTGYIYDTNGKKLISVKTNTIYLIKKRTNGFYLMKMGI